MVGLLLWRGAVCLMESIDPAPGFPDALRLDDAFINEGLQGVMGFLGQGRIPIDIVAEKQDVVAGKHRQHDGFLDVIFPGNGLHLHIVADNHALPAKPLPLITSGERVAGISPSRPEQNR